MPQIGSQQIGIFDIVKSKLRNYKTGFCGSVRNKDGIKINNGLGFLILSGLDIFMVFNRVYYQGICGAVG